jgi:PAS domain S-box-containing protein
MSQTTPKPARRPWRLQQQLTLALSLLVLLLAAAGSLAIYTAQERVLLAGIDTQLRTAATLARELVPADYHDRITGTNSVPDADYQRLVDRYNQLCQTLGLEYLWSLLMVDGRIVFTTATSPDKVVANRKHAAFFELHSNPELYLSTFASMAPTYQDNVDKWGRIRVVLLPFKDRQGRPYLYGASVSLAQVDAQLRRLLYQCLFGGLLLGALGITVSYLLARKVTQPLNQLTATIEGVAAGNPALVAEEAGSHEQQVLAASFNRLNRALQEQVLELANQVEHERITLNSIGDAVLTTDNQARLTRLNPTAERLTGWPAKEAVGRPLPEVLHIINAVTRAPVTSPVEQVLAQGEVIALANHTVLLARDGQEYQIADSAAPIRDRAGQIVGVVLVLSDVTEQYRVQAALRESERQMTTLLGNLPAMAYRCRNDRDWTMLFASGGCLELTGYPVEDLLVGPRITYGELIHPDDRAAVWDQVQASLARRERYELQYRLITATGVEKWIWESGRGVFSERGELEALEGINFDITERRQAAEALRTNRAMLQQILDTVPQAIFWKDKASVYLGCNQVFARAVGLSDSQPIAGKTDFDLPWPRAEAEAYRTDDAEVMASGQPKRHLEEPLQQADGTRLWIDTTKLPRDAQGEVQGVLGVYEDVTERKRTEAALRTAVRNQEALLQEVHHRVKNNLQVISSLLRLEASRSEHLPTKSVLKDMQNRIRAMALLHEAVYRSGQFAEVDLTRYLQQVTQKLFRALAPAGEAIRLRLELAPVRLALDQAVPCGLLVNELVANALKHGFPDGRGGEIHVAVACVDGGPQVRLRVADTGIGLPADFAARRGQSLGLQLVSDLTRQLQGRLEIGPGPAAVFEVTFTPPPSHFTAAAPEISP